ncbi:hypothetical protein N0V90_000616 [Kalmusia sp. IMI 367209]|nr:hypothetical protein N0V90_000616 [Kalmusia sp. IMI 367209]
MRRIPRPQRAIDPSLPISPLLQRRILPPSCLRAASPHPCIRTTSAHFSTTPTFNFLLTGKHDKKKHQQSIRRWQKRLLGDSEPIGAHVDPYDPTSPVRIAPEEQGEEVEVLEDDERMSEILADNGAEAVYKEATVGTDLLHVGGKQWTDQMEEGNIAKEFEKLTLRTYTPMTMNMANEIEDLTGTLYTLRDENLMMGQTFEEHTGKPYTESSFGRWERVRNPDSLRKSFHQAVVEIYALKQAGKDLDISKQANRGIYDAPQWLKDVKIQKDGDANFVLAFPSGISLETLLREVQRVPETPLASEILGEGMEQELLADEGGSVTIEEPSPPPTMDPATPAFKRAALVKEDPDKKKFDFMSNRPVPRTKPTEPVAEVVETIQDAVEEPAATSKPAPSSSTIDIDIASASSSSAISEMRHAVLESAAHSAEQNVSAIRDALRDSMTSFSVKAPPRAEKFDAEAEARWRHVPLTDAETKFALSKRLAQLTGQYISDFNLTSARTLGDLYHHICGAAKPATSKVHAYINIEGARQNQRMEELQISQPDAAALAAKRKAHVGELLELGNVKIHRVRPNKVQQRTQIGLYKEVGRKLQLKDLINNERPRRFNETIVEGTKLVPSFGLPVSPNATQKLKERTESKREEWEKLGLPVDKIIEHSNRIVGQTV